MPCPSPNHEVAASPPPPHPDRRRGRPVRLRRLRLLAGHRCGPERRPCRRRPGRQLGRQPRPVRQAHPHDQARPRHHHDHRQPDPGGRAGVLVRRRARRGRDVAGRRRRRRPAGADHSRRCASKIGEYKSVGLRATPNIQVITALKPDLIVADSGRHKAIYDQLSKIAPTIAYPSLNGNYQQVLDSEMSTAIALNKCDQMKTRLAEHAKMMTELKAKVPADEKRKALFVRAVGQGLHRRSRRRPTRRACWRCSASTRRCPDETERRLGLAHPGDAGRHQAGRDVHRPQRPADPGRDQWQKSPLWKEVPAVKNNATLRGRPERSGPGRAA